ncbi:hypothetical protein FHS83_001883 [Rhizomicrobium palustre]|uniref:Uncharacterized protein n=1 Tax=Rhizomicrobium palustre TaxID=189966 RepID=A0A846MZA4_9PROT|nr:hypothetical protein [Rhizomicrobium palustre]NIK88565.1 hypothetical protein [Rhizomicrobium palustre]
MGKVSQTLTARIATALIILFCNGAAFASPPCALTPADKAANAALSYDDFDQKGALPSSFRALDTRGCDREAAAAAEDYMLHHPGLSDGERINVLFHEGQSLAVSGAERTAAMLIAAAKDLSQKPDDPFDWNTYVEGTWAFLVKERGRLEAATTKLSSSRGEGNAINAQILRGLLGCFDRTYKEAYGNEACMRPKTK